MKPSRIFAATILAGMASAVHADPTLTASPALPGYGQDVVLDMQGAPAPIYLPATRYVRSGTSITVDYEYYFDGFGPSAPRADLGSPEVPLGQLAPGNYQLTARFIDLSTGDVTQTTQGSLAVVPPQDWGVYVVPSAPQANDVVQVLVRSAAYFDPTTLKATVSGNVVRVDFAYRASAPTGGPVPAGLTSFATVSVGHLAPGAYVAEGWGHPDTGGDPQRYFSTPFTVDTRINVVEYYQDTLNHYFMASGADEIDLLDAGGAGGWKRTGQGFHAWASAADAPAGAHAVCRFYAAGPNSHFYTGDDAECAGLKTLEQSQRADAAAMGQPFLGWAYEGIAFWTLMPAGGQCPGGTEPVWRSYNDRAAEDDSNHRFTVDPQLKAAMDVEWTDEGVAFCSPQ